MQERRNSITNALELRLSCTNPLKYIASLKYVPIHTVDSGYIVVIHRMMIHTAQQLQWLNFYQTFQSWKTPHSSAVKASMGCLSWLLQKKSDYDLWRAQCTAASLFVVVNKMARHQPDENSLPSGFINTGKVSFILPSIIIPRQMRWGWVYWFHFISLSVHLSVCRPNSVCCVSFIILVESILNLLILSTNFTHTHTINLTSNERDQIWIDSMRWANLPF